MWFILLSPPGRPGERMPERVSTGVVSPNYFPMLGVRAELGRLLTEADDRAGAPAALLLTHDYWQRAFDGDPSVVGRVFEMNDRPHTVVGVLAPFPQYSQAVDVYMPTSACPFRSNPATIAQRRARMGQAVGRAADGVSLESLQENLARVAARLEQREPGIYADPGGPYVAHGVAARRGNAPGASPDAAAPGGRGGAGAAHRLRQRRQPDADALHAALARAAAALRARRHAKAPGVAAAGGERISRRRRRSCWACCSRSSP